MTVLVATAAAPEPIPATAPARALIEDQISALTRLTRIGMQIAEDCGRRSAEASQSADAGWDPGLAFARVARAVRMTIALQSRLAKDLAALDQGEAIEAETRKDQRRMRLSRLVGQCAEATIKARRDAAHRVQGRYWDEAKVEDEIERLSEEAYERLTDAEDGDLGDAPFADAVAAICADLGLSPEWTARLSAATVAPPRPAARTPPPDPPAPDAHADERPPPAQDRLASPFATDNSS